MRLKNHLHRRRRSSLVMHDTRLYPWSIEKEGRRKHLAPRMRNDLFKGRVPVIVVKDNTGQSIGRDLYGYSFLTAMLSNSQTLNIVFEDCRGWKNGNMI